MKYFSKLCEEARTDFYSQRKESNGNTSNKVMNKIVEQDLN